MTLAFEGDILPGFYFKKNDPLADWITKRTKEGISPAEIGAVYHEIQARIKGETPARTEPRGAQSSAKPPGDEPRAGEDPESQLLNGALSINEYLRKKGIDKDTLEEAQFSGQIRAAPTRYQQIMQAAISEAQARAEAIQVPGSGRKSVRVEKGARHLKWRHAAEAIRSALSQTLNPFAPPAMASIPKAMADKYARKLEGFNKKKEERARQRQNEVEAIIRFAHEKNGKTTPAQKESPEEEEADSSPLSANEPHAGTSGSAQMSQSEAKGASSPEPETVPARTETPNQQGFNLEQHTQADLDARAEADKQTAERERREREAAENRARAEREAKDFRLTGSGREADVAMVHGQQDLLAMGGNKAEQGLHDDKHAREQNAERAARGERPSGVVETARRSRPERTQGDSEQTPENRQGEGAERSTTDVDESDEAAAEVRAEDEASRRQSQPSQDLAPAVDRASTPTSSLDARELMHAIAAMMRAEEQWRFTKEGDHFLLTTYDGDPIGTLPGRPRSGNDASAAMGRLLAQKLKSEGIKLPSNPEEMSLDEFTIAYEGGVIPDFEIDLSDIGGAVKENLGGGFQVDIAELCKKVQAQRASREEDAKTRPASGKQAPALEARQGEREKEGRSGSEVARSAAKEGQTLRGTRKDGALYSRRSAQDKGRQLESLYEAATNDPRLSQTVELRSVTPAEAEEARANGVDLKGYRHSVDSDALRHTRRKHGDTVTEASRGQLAITKEDIRRIPEVIDAPDEVIYGLNNKRGQDQIIYLKRFQDGSALYITEARTGKRHLAMESMRKYPAATRASSIMKTLGLNARNDGGDNISIVARSNERKMSGTPTGPEGTINTSGPVVTRSGAPPRGMSEQQVQRLARRILGMEPIKARVSIVGSLAELPNVVRRAIAADGVSDGDIKALHWRGRSWLLADQLGSPREVEEAIYHEHYTHGGLRVKWGSELGSTLDSLIKGVGGIEGVRTQASAQNIDLSEYELALSDNPTMSARDRQRVLMEELLAHMSQATGRLKRVLEEWLGAVRDFLRRHGFAELAEYNASDLAHVLREAREAARRQASAQATKPAYQRVFHGTPHRGIEQEGFKLQKIGTGEGAQTYGWGIYFSNNRDIARFYASNLAPNVFAMDPRLIGKALYKHAPEEDRLGMPEAEFIAAYANDEIDNSDFSTQTWDDATIELGRSQLYHAEIPEDSDLLDWDKPLSAQPQEVREALRQAIDLLLPPQTQRMLERMPEFHTARAWLVRGDPDGERLYLELTHALGGQKEASQYLNSIGIPGLRYKAGRSSGHEGKSYNYVIWDESILNNDITPYYARTDAPEQFRPNPREAEGYREKLRKTMASHRANVEPISLGRTPAVFRALGAKDLPLMISRDVVRKATNGVKHVVPMDAVERLPEELHDPLAVFRSRTHADSLVAVTELKDANGKPVVVAVDLRARPGRIEVNRIAGLYGKDGRNPFAQWSHEGLLAYESKRARSASGLKGLLLPNRIPAKASGPDSILHESDITSRDITPYYSRNANGDISAAQLRRELEAVPEVRDTQGRLLAPSGKPSKLNERQWKQVRTERFKQFFGDWEAVAKREQLRRMSPVDVGNNEIMAAQTLPEARRIAREAYRKIQQQTVSSPVVTTDGLRVRFGGAGFRETASHAADRRVLAVIPALPDLLGKAEPTQSAQPTGKADTNIKAFHYYAAKASFPQGEAYVRMVVREEVNGSFYYDNDATSVEHVEKAPNELSPLPRFQSGSDTTALEPIHSLAAWWHAVKPDAVSKMVDASGEPLVVYKSNAVDSVLSGKPAIPESGMDGLRGNAELLSNLLKGETFRLHGLGGFDVPTQRVVLASVLSFGKDKQVLRSVVELIPVDVMNILRGQNRSAESLFSNEAMLKKLLTTDSNGSVSTAIDIADALVVAVTGVAAKGVGPFGVSAGTKKGSAAPGADYGYLAVSSHDPNVLEFKPTGNRGTFDRREPNIRHSFAGRGAISANTLSLSEAKVRIAAGEDAEQVRQRTGWHRGADGRWRFEISDHEADIAVPGSTAKAILDNASGKGSLNLADVLDHPALFAAYPRLGQMPIERLPDDARVSARLARTATRWKVQVSPDLTRNQLTSALLHELQHGIQAIEGFARGGFGQAVCQRHG